jgi:hypothetical protein
LEEIMRKPLMAIAAAASIAVASMAIPTKAEAGCRGCWVGAAVAGGLIGSAIIANSAYAYGGGYGYAPAYYGGYGGYDYGYVTPTYYSYPAPVTYGYAPAYYGYAPSYYRPRPVVYGGYRPYRAYYGAYGYYGRPRAYVRSYYRPWW